MNDDGAGRAQGMAIGSETRLAILREAAALFRQRHYDAVSTRDIANACGIKQPSIYWYFPNKRAIMVELIDMDITFALPIATWLDRVDASPAARLYRFLLMDTEHLANDPYNIVGIYDTDVLDHPDFSDVRRRARRLQTAYRRLLRQGIDEGQFISVPVELAREMLVGVDMHAGRIGPKLTRSQRSALPRWFTSMAIRALLVDPSSIEAVRAEAESMTPPPGVGSPPTG